MTRTPRTSGFPRPAARVRVFPPTTPHVRSFPRARRAPQDGQAAIEYVGVLTLLLVVAMAVVQLGIAVYAAQQAGTASRSGARVGSYDRATMSADQAAYASMSGWLADDADVSVSNGFDEVTVTVEIDIPAVIPVFDFGEVSKSATMPRG
ncbi:TadE/TadG family type IV pilus assembly protein [Streptomyces fulvorobeus]|uniref:Flp pilus assembly protein TadG n=1 Tax=Streptomyces fulvorobeus TaxID=284028 RepID=A0A7J0C9A3_9ACTN|nr:TadE/TadG family type IV pilus assembly protein [Streptomyces fulvorobeus]NYE42659.1 Flp pilus assembly protein TadG [Streptomyces fulvorobeus]GFM99069.1 septum formation initiator [Streptomyces fulvorobeus]